MLTGSLCVADFTLLHLSDVHFGIDDPGAKLPLATQALTQAVQRAGLRPDLCVFSGDLAQAGTPAQFAQGRAWLEALLKPFGCPLAIVPGNHDLDRQAAERRILRAASPSAEAYGDWRDKLAPSKRFQAFIDTFSAAQCGQQLRCLFDWEQGLFVASHRGVYNGLALHLIGLNTALTSVDNKDQGQLVADVESLNRLLAQVQSDEELVLVVGHHPIDWLVEWNRHEIERALGRNHNGAHALLCGHMHAADTATFANGRGASLTTLAAGAVYQSDQYSRHFAFYEFSLTQREIQPWVYVHNDVAGEWELNAALSKPFVSRLPLPRAGAGREDSPAVARHVKGGPSKRETKFSGPAGQSALSGGLESQGGVAVVEQANGQEVQTAPRGEGLSGADEGRLSIFISYAHADEAHLATLETRLKAIQRRLPCVYFWHDRNLLAGSIVQDEIMARLAEAEIVILLISPDFMASDYCFTLEMNAALQRFESGYGIVIPVIVRETPYWHTEAIGQLLALPTDGWWLSHNHWGGDSDAFWGDVQRGLSRCIEERLKARDFPQVATSVGQGSSALPAAPFNQVLKGKIADVLSAEAARPLLDDLRQGLSALPSASPLDIADHLVSGADLSASLRSVYRAVTTTLPRLQGRNDGHLDGCRQAASSLFGWLVLRAVDDQWLLQNAHLLHTSIRVRITSEAVIEVILSRLDERQGSWRETKGPHAIGSARLAIDDGIECGYSDSVRLQQVACAIWKAVFRDSTMSELSGDDFETLDARLCVLREWEKERRYLTIKQGIAGTTHSELYRALSHKLPNLQLVYIDLQDGYGDMLITSATLLGQQIYLFVDYMEKFK